MFLTKLLNKIPYFRNRKIKKIKKELVEIKKDFEEGFFNQKYIISLHNILNTGLIKFSGENVENSVDTLTLHSKSSVSVLKLLENKVVKKSVLERSPLISMAGQHGYFTEWYSHEESVIELVNILERYIEADIWQNKELDIETAEAVGKQFEDIDPDILESLLYRLLLEDLVSILTFYLERQ